MIPSLHAGHLTNTDAVFVLGTMVYWPVAAVCLVAAMDAGARSGIRPALGFMERYGRCDLLVKTAAFLLVLSGSIDLGFVPSHLKTEPLAAGLFGLDALVLIGCGLLVVVLARLRPAALILLGGGIFAYLVGGVQLDHAAAAAKGIEGLAIVLLIASLVRTRGLREPELASRAVPELEAASEPVEASARRGRRHRRGLHSTKRPTARRPTS